MKKSLSQKCNSCNFQELFQKKGYKYFTKGDYNLNIIGVRSDNKGKVTNLYDDYLVLIYNVNNVENRFIYPITTEPGNYYMHKPCNPKGSGILVPGQYSGCWKLGLHKGKYQALCQAKPVKVYRDNNKNDIYDCNPETIDEGMFGINIHRSNEYLTSVNVNNWSAGCQVFSNPNNFNEFIRICKEQEKRYGNNFTYTLINEKDLS